MENYEAGYGLRVMIVWVKVRYWGKYGIMLPPVSLTIGKECIPYAMH